MTKPLCKRCLLIEAGQQNLSEIISERVSVIPDSEKSSAESYARRLEICRTCDLLNSGTCAKCGCYVELRAARADAYCPDYPAKW